MSTEWILSRALCRYRVVDFAEVPRSKRAAVLRLQLSQFAPFSDPGYAVAWEGAAAQVWCWDAAKLREAASGAGVTTGRLHVVPEPLYFLPLHDGPRLVKVAEGYEGQVWRERALARSRFWPTLPDGAEWVAFQRDASLAPEQQQAQPSPVELEMLSQPYAKVGEGLAHTSGLSLAEPALLFVLVATLGISSAWYLSRYWKITARSDELTAQFKSLQRSAAPVLAAREHAIDNEAFANRLARIALYPDQLSLIAAFASALGGYGIVLRDWNFNLGRLRATVAFPNALPPSSSVVTAVQEQQAFANVRVAPGNDPKSLVINADVKPIPNNDEQPSS